MQMEQLPRQVRCSCKAIHTCDVEHVYIERGAVLRLAKLCEGFSRVAVAADANTYDVCGDAVCSVIGVRRHSTKIFPKKELLVPDEAAAAALQTSAAGADLLIGIGSGVIQDLCKFVSFRMGIPYIIVATAPSMDGYASSGAAMILNRMKVTVPCRVPKAILADPAVLKEAPMELIQAGYGDILGKYSCLCDWKLSHVVTGEALCDAIYDFTMSMVKKTEPLAEALLRRDEDSVKILMEALVAVGFAMSYAGSSRPASGSEHHLSHFFEIVGLLSGEPYLPHGIDVAYSAYVTQRLRETLAERGLFPYGGRFCREKWEAGVRRLYGRAAQGVIDLQNRVGLHDTNRADVYEKREKEILAVLKQGPDSAAIAARLERIGLDIRVFYDLYGKEKIDDALWYAKELKDRYTVLWLLGDVAKNAPYRFAER